MENQNLGQGPTGSVQLRQELPTVKVTVSGISVIICPRDLPQDLNSVLVAPASPELPPLQQIFSGASRLCQRSRRLFWESKYFSWRNNSTKR